MGIRIHKMIGYGFDDLVEDDPRIDWDRYEEAIELDSSEFHAYLAIVRDRDDTAMSVYHILEKDTKWHMYEHVTYDNEFGLSSVMLFRHPSHKGWSRRGDDIDYYEAMMNQDDLAPKCKRIQRPIYPYETNIFIHLETNQTVSSDTIRFAQIGEKAIQLPDGTIIPHSKNMMDHFVPELPSFIKHYALFMGVHPDHVHCMRPLLYEYWS